MKIEHMEDLTIEVTDKCPLECKYCSTEAGPKGEEYLSLDLAKDTFSGLEKTETANISGGEPFEYGDLIPLVEFLDGRSDKLKIYTTGAVMKNGELEPLSKEKMKKTREAGADRLVFPYHHSNKEIHDNFTQTEGSYLANELSRKKAKEVGYEIGVHIVPMKINLGSLEEMTEKVIQEGVDEVSFLRLVRHGRAKDNYKELKVQDEDKLSQILEGLKDQYQDKVDIGGHLQAVCDADRGCRAGLQKLNVTPEGYLFPCVGLKNLMKRGKENNLYQNDLEEALKSEPFETVHDIQHEHPFQCSTKILEKEDKKSLFDRFVGEIKNFFSPHYKKIVLPKRPSACTLHDGSTIKYGEPKIVSYKDKEVVYRDVNRDKFVIGYLKEKSPKLLTLKAPIQREKDKKELKKLISDETGCSGKVIFFRNPDPMGAAIMHMKARERKKENSDLYLV